MNFHLKVNLVCFPRQSLRCDHNELIDGLTPGDYIE